LSFGACRLRRILSQKSIGTLALSLSPVEQFLVRSEDLDLASRLFIDAGVAVGPKRATSSCPPRGDGAWLRVDGSKPPKLDDLKALCASSHLFQLEATTPKGQIYVQVGTERGQEASGGGEVKEAKLLEKVTLSSPSVREVQSNWLRLAERCTVVLELCENPEKLIGYWLFASSGLFALVFGPRCCGATRYEGPVGPSAQLELEATSDAILGKVESPGLLKVIRRAWSEAGSAGSASDLLDTFGNIEVDEEEEILVQQHGDGTAFRWRILQMDENPFVKPGVEKPQDVVDRDALQSEEHLGRSRSPRKMVEERATDGKELAKAKKEKKDKGEKDLSKEKEKEKKEKKEKEREKKEKEKERRHPSRGKSGEKTRQKVREREREAERAREREAREKEKERESRDKHKRPLERSHAFDRPGPNVLPNKPPPTPRTAPPAQISQALPSQANATALLAAIHKANLGHEHNPEVETFLSMNSVEPHAATKLRALPRHLQRQVLDRGSLMGARDPSAVLISRVRDAMMSSAHTMPSMPLLTMTLPNGQQVHPAVEALIIRYALDAQCAQQLRQLPLQLQAVAAELPVHEARNPSAFVMAQLQLPRFKQAAKAMMQKPS